MSDILPLPADLIDSITCDKLCEDGYNVENLLPSAVKAPDQSTSSKSVPSFFPNLDLSSSRFPKLGAFLAQRLSSHGGFMVGSFVRPPATIKYRFRRPINLQAVYLGLSVGTQKTQAFQIFVGDQDEDRSNIQIDRRVASVYFSNPEVVPREFLVARRNCGIEQKIRSEIPNDQNLGIDYFGKVFLLDRVKVLTIKITKAYYIPCLGFVKIYIRGIGVPGKHFDNSNCDHRLENQRSIISDNRSEEDRKTVSVSGIEQRSKDAVDRQSAPREIDNDDDQPSTSAKSRRITSQTPDTDQSSTSVSIPKEFFDPITHLCMSLPIILPSGHTIDRLTLEKYLEEEARFGRLPNDPFTNVRFTDVSTPIPNGRLKERIDKFFLMYPDLAKEEDYGRTLCTGGQYTAFRKSVPEGKFLKRKLDGGTDRIKMAVPMNISTKEDKIFAGNHDGGGGSAPKYVRDLLHGLPSFL